MPRTDGGEPADFTRFAHILTGPAVAARLFEDKTIRAGIERAGKFGFLSGFSPGNPAALSEYLQKHVRFAPAGPGSLRRIDYLHPDPDFAVYLVGALHGAADNLIRLDVRKQTDERIAYLSRQLEATAHPRHKQAIISILMGQEHTRMMASMDEPYAATIAEPPWASSSPAWPRKTIILPVLILSGMILGYAAYGLRRTRA
jgi:hypothetical protein